MHQKLLSTFSQHGTIILVGGGTGGHIQPILNLAEELREKKLLWIGGKDSNEEKEAKNANIQFESISTMKLSTTKSPKVLLYPLFLLKGIIAARKILVSVIARDEAIQVHDKQSTGSLHASRGQDQQANNSGNQRICVFSKGGPGSVAAGIAAWTLGLPLYIHESDTVPGRSNRILARFATKVFLGFESARKYFDAKKCETIGQILHRVFSSHCEPAIVSTPLVGEQSSKEKQKPLDRFVPRDDRIKWQTEKPHILVICGSQGAKSIFEAIIKQFSEDTDYEWIIALGKLNEGMKKDFEKMKYVQALEWISQEDIAYLLYDTNLTITRGSATTLAEIDLFGVKKIIIPLPFSGGNHQYWNAREYEKKGDILLEQKDIAKLSEIIIQTLPGKNP